MQGSAKDFLKPKLVESAQTANNEFKIIHWVTHLEERCYLLWWVQQ